MDRSFLALRQFFGRKPSNDNDRDGRETAVRKPKRPRRGARPDADKPDGWSRIEF